jgi:hypothetical protein
MKIRLVGAELCHADRRTDMMKLMVAFRNVANAPKMCTEHVWSGAGYFACEDSCVLRLHVFCTALATRGVTVDVRVSYPHYTVLGTLRCVWHCGADPFGIFPSLILNAVVCCGWLRNRVFYRIAVPAVTVVLVTALRWPLLPSIAVIGPISQSTWFLGLVSFPVAYNTFFRSSISSVTSGHLYRM